ncbi:uncharacterized protein BXZ73DRAFT_105069 [Epithele typhae]|uniref:uncharacterized protein n=1 Tax=Epithele typhae TaxID=378194 RepID=UPI002007D678|nr:uncharacterized protein BXZ73DRAFT_105069 [Epithele typhae]KAH9918912.1 hypothetical protein BXZ73DRAFT_105069 [Epithele typhae]
MANSQRSLADHPHHDTPDLVSFDSPATLHAPPSKTLQSGASSTRGSPWWSSGAQAECLELSGRFAPLISTISLANRADLKAPDAICVFDRLLSAVELAIWDVWRPVLIMIIPYDTMYNLMTGYAYWSMSFSRNLDTSQTPPPCGPIVAFAFVASAPTLTSVVDNPEAMNPESLYGRLPGTRDQSQQLFDVLSGSTSTLTYLNLRLEWLTVEGFLLASFINLQRLSVTMPDNPQTFSEPASLRKLNALMDLGLPQSLLALEITLDKSLSQYFGLERSSEQERTLRNPRMLLRFEFVYSGMESEIFPGMDTEIIASSWSPNGAQILVLLSSMDLDVWNADGSSAFRLPRCPSFPEPITTARISISRHYALIHLTGFENRNHIHVVDLVSGKLRPRLVNLWTEEYVSPAVLRCGSERGDFTVLALTRGGTLVVDRGEEDAPASSTPPPAPSPLHGLTPQALSADGTRALCFVDAARPSDPPPTAPQFCVVDTVTGEMLSGPFGGERPSVIIGEHRSMDIERTEYSPYCGGWFWSTLHGKLYRTPALDGRQDVARFAVSYDGSTVGWSDSGGVVRFHRNAGDV